MLSTRSAFKSTSPNYFQFKQIYWTISTNTFCNLEVRQGVVHPLCFQIKLVIIFKLEKVQILGLEKYFLQFGQIHLAISTNTFYNLEARQGVVHLFYFQINISKLFHTTTSSSIHAQNILGAQIHNLSFKHKLQLSCIGCQMMWF